MILGCIGLAEKFIQVFPMMLSKNLTEYFGQPNINASIVSASKWAMISRVLDSLDRAEVLLNLEHLSLRGT